VSGSIRRKGDIFFFLAGPVEFPHCDLPGTVNLITRSNVMWELWTGISGCLGLVECYDSGMFLPTIRQPCRYPKVLTKN
jgi:hypothetical protein